MQPGNSPLEKLPHDLHQQVLGYLDNDDLAQLQGVSQTTYNEVLAYFQRQLAAFQQELQQSVTAVNALVEEMNTYMNR
ncbi:hypothetical protein [Krasilnikovia sp. MM14-A1004]|uniref:hypothetical protein n=1 Tax=Krasilnikovia sp. MM14-A1004 TaxID=3373541 RepID=UPI00399C68A0